MDLCRRGAWRFYMSFTDPPDLFPKMRAYLSKALYRNGYKRHELASFAERILDVLRQAGAQSGDAHLLSTIEAKLTRLGKTKEKWVPDADLDLLRKAVRCIVETRGRRRRENLEQLSDDVDQIPSREVDPFELVAIEELRQRVRLEIERRLTLAQQKLAKDLYWEGMTKAEVADKTGKHRQRVYEAEAAVAEILRSALEPIWADTKARRISETR
jgi:hypothetical protein